jgi:cytidyltransferase-like protein
MDIFTEKVNNYLQHYLFEEDRSFHRIGIFPGAFKPPHVGHYNVALQACQQNDEVFLFMSKKSRPIGKIQPDTKKGSPDIKRYENIFKTDKFTSNLGNIKTINPIFKVADGEVSASLIRHAISIGDEETISKNLPDLEKISEKNDVLDIMMQNRDEITLEQAVAIWEIYKSDIENKTNTPLNINVSDITPVMDTYDKVKEINKSAEAPETEINLYVGDK